MLRRPVRHRFAALALAVLATAACSPTFNWREVPVGDDGVVVLLPCKPDRAARELSLGIESVTVNMAGCKVGGATFAVAQAQAADAAQAETWLRAWHAATRSQLAGAPVVESAAKLTRAALAPAALRIDTAVHDADGQAIPTHILWFAQDRAGKVSLYQATVLGDPSSPEALATFFEGLRIP